MVNSLLGCRSKRLHLPVSRAEALTCPLCHSINIPYRVLIEEGYGAFTVSASQCKTVRHYIEWQAEHHRTRTFREEYLELLRRHGVEFDERYLIRRPCRGS